MLRIESADREPLLSEIRILMSEYGAIPGVAPCVEDFQRELVSLPGSYAPPEGRLLIAVLRAGNQNAVAVGCVALRKLGPDICEMKRLYVRPEFRGAGAGQNLVEKLISEARQLGHKKMLLDTLPSMQDAHKLYRRLGFAEIPSYQKNPIPGALFFELGLR